MSTLVDRLIECIANRQLTASDIHACWKLKNHVEKVPESVLKHIPSSLSFARAAPWAASERQRKLGRVTDPTKFVGLALSLLAFSAMAQLPQWFDPRLNMVAINMGWNRISSPWAPVFQPLITMSWWLFLTTFVTVNVFQVAWAGMGYNFRRREWQKASPEGRAQPSVAILVPAYNEEASLDRTFKSLVNQTYPNITQIILIDDGSTDRTAEISRGWTALDPRISYHYEENQGKPSALNNGFARSNADLTFFMDGDSHVDERCIERLVLHFVNDPQIGAVSSFVAIHNNKTLMAKLQEIEYFFNQLVTRFVQSLEKTVIICPGCGTMVRTQIAKTNLHSKRTIAEDADFTFQIHRDWRIGQEPDAVSYTDAMTNMRSLKNQRMRWLYGILQTVVLHREREATSKLWILWAWVGCIVSPVPLAALVLLPVIVCVLGPHFVPFITGYAAVSLLLAWPVIAAPMLWHPVPSKKLALFVPLYMCYQQYLNIMQMYCIFQKVTGRGVTVRFGPRRIHTV